MMMATDMPTAVFCSYFSEFRPIGQSYFAFPAHAGTNREPALSPIDRRDVTISRYSSTRSRRTIQLAMPSPVSEELSIRA
jgi:hypothetical protein